MQQKIKLHLSKDTQLATIIQATKLPRYQSNSDVYFALLRSIQSQQLSVKAAETIFNRFLALFPTNYPEPQQLLHLSEENLRGVGLSRQKSLYVKEVAHFFEQESPSQALWKKMDDEAVIKYLTQIKGVGRWTVQMILMFTLNRPDIFPIDDLGIRQSMINLYGVQAEKRALNEELEKIAAQWRPFRTHACRYLWQWKDGGT